MVAGLARPALAGQFNAESFTLKNGLQVVVVPFHRTPAVTQMLWYKVGSADELPGKSGITHFLEHLMFRGTKETPPGGFSCLVAQIGGRDNAFTDTDYTAFYQTVASDRLEFVMKLEAERMTDLVISDAVVAPEREVILEERRSRIDNEPSALLSEQGNAVLFLNHHYRLPVIGWEHEMRGLTTEDARSFYQTWYAPNNAILVIAGDVEAGPVRALAEKYYGPVPERPVPMRHPLAEPPKVASTRLEMTSARVAEAQWNRNYLAPSYTAEGGRPADALDVLASVLGGGATSRLYRSLVIEKKLAIGTAAGYSAGRDAGTFTVWAIPRPEVSVADLEAAIAAEIAAVTRDGVSQQEVQQVEHRMVANAVYARDSLSAPARIIGSALASGRSLEEVEAWPERIGSIGAAEITAAARRVLQDSTAVTTVLLPEKRS